MTSRIMRRLRPSIPVLGLALSLVTGCDGTTDPSLSDDLPEADDEDASAELRHGDIDDDDEVPLGAEVAVARHLRDGEERRISLRRLLAHGELLFTAVWTGQEGGGRPLTKGDGSPLSDPESPLLFPRNFNRLSAPDSNSCSGCHNAPRIGGGGDIVTAAFLPVQRFDFVTFDPNDTVPTRGGVDERGEPVTFDSIGDARATIGMFGAGFIEMLSRQMSLDLQRLRDCLRPGQSIALVSKGISFGRLARRADGSWDTSGVTGLSTASLASDAATPPSLLIRPFFQSSNMTSLRDFTNTAFNHHFGIQSTERFGVGTDPDGDGFSDEMTRADITAAVVFQATLEVPGRVIPTRRSVERAIWRGEQTFSAIGCATCHTPSLPLTDEGWIYSEPGPFNPAGNLQPGQATTFEVDLTSDRLPQPRLREHHGVVQVPAYTDLKLHDITTGPDDPNAVPIDFGEAVGSEAFFTGNRRFITKKLWGVGNEAPYFHHGKFTTLREAILNHRGEAEASYQAFTRLSDADQAAVIEFLKSLRLLPPGTRSLVVDQHGRPRSWPPRW
jgi:cytochrome c peroxidase